MNCNFIIARKFTIFNYNISFIHKPFLQLTARKRENLVSFLNNSDFDNFSTRERTERKSRFDFRRVLHEKNVGREFIWLAIINFARAISLWGTKNSIFFFFAETRTSPLTIATKREFKSIIGLCDILFIQSRSTPFCSNMYLSVNQNGQKTKKTKKKKKFYGKLNGNLTLWDASCK